MTISEWDADGVWARIETAAKASKGSAWLETSDFAVKEDDDEEKFDGVTICGYLSTFKNVDRQGDIVAATAFDKTLKSFGGLPIFLDHVASVDAQVGRWHTASVDGKGLRVSGRVSLTPRTEHLIKLIRDGAINTLSMGGIFRYGAADKNGSQVIDEVDLMEGSIVGIPANPKAVFRVKDFRQIPATGSGAGVVSRKEQIKNLIRSNKNDCKG